MKNNGFTLAELLIALTIMGIIATLLVRTINNIMPDQEIINLRKAYNTITNTARDLINNNSLYPRNGAGFCTNADVFVNNFKGNLNIIEDNNYTFKTADGIQFQIVNQCPNQFQITVKTVSNRKSGDCFYPGCSEPNMFNFYVNTNGKVSNENNDIVNCVLINSQVDSFDRISAGCK